MKIGHTLLSFGVVVFIYLMTLIWVDSKNQIFAEFPRLVSVLPTMMGLSLASYLLRYLRWYCLLSRAGNKIGHQRQEPIRFISGVCCDSSGGTSVCCFQPRLAGAASMLPGGVGSTEAALVALLSLFEVPMGIAILAAVGIRLATMWFAVLCGLCALGILEVSRRAFLMVSESCTVDYL